MFVVHDDNRLQELKPNMRKGAPSDVSEFGSMIMDLSEAFPGIDEISGLLEVFQYAASRVSPHILSAKASSLMHITDK
jgi:hypothetical protein